MVSLNGLQNTSNEVAQLFKLYFSVDQSGLLKLHFFFDCCSVGRGGQSALRFARLRMEKRHNYVRKVAETAVQLFISNDRVSGKFNDEPFPFQHR